MLVHANVEFYCRECGQRLEAVHNMDQLRNMVSRIEVSLCKYCVHKVAHQKIVKECKLKVNDIDNG